MQAMPGSDITFNADQLVLKPLTLSNWKAFETLFGERGAWCAFAPREDFIKMERSRIHKRIDDERVWSIPCLFVNKKFRNKGISLELLKAVIQYAAKKKHDEISLYLIPGGHDGCLQVPGS